MRPAADPLDGSQVFHYILWLLATIAVLIVCYAVISHIRSRWLGADTPTSGEAFTLEQLRTLLREGKMSAEELDRAKAVILAVHQRSLQPPPPPQPPAAGPPQA
jgi:uncharacterized membrane protein